MAQKVQGGSLAPNSEMVLEVAEARLSQVHVDGSLRVQADSVMGGSEHALAVNYNQIRSRHDLQLRQRHSRMQWCAQCLQCCLPHRSTSACSVTQVAQGDSCHDFEDCVETGGIADFLDTVTDNLSDKGAFPVGLTV